MNHESLRIAARFALGLAVAALAGGLQGGIVAPTPNLPPPGVYHMSPGDFLDFDVPGWAKIRISEVAHQPLPPVAVTPLSPDEEESFNSIAWMLVAVDLGFDSSFDLLFNLVLSGQTRVLLRNYPDPITGRTGTFQTEMLSMDLTGSTPFGPVMIRESPTLPSVGQTTVADLGSGQYQIDSFFDIFTELSLDGGQSWILPTSPEPKRMTLPDRSSTAALIFLATGAWLAGARCWGAKPVRRRQGLRTTPGNT